ncbi:MAG: hypothetical protein AAF990_04175 [Bacteroidota bacterium]
MHSKETDTYYDNYLREDVKNYFPDFESLFDDDDGLYLIFSDLGDFIIENLSRDEFIATVADFIKIALNKGQGKTEDLIVIQIFHKVYASVDNSNRFRSFLKGRELEIFDGYLEHYLKHYNR